MIRIKGICFLTNSLFYVPNKDFWLSLNIDVKDEMKMKRNILFFAAAIALMSASCVSQKKYNAAVNKADSLAYAQEKCQKELNVSNGNLGAINNDLKHKLAEMAKDTASQSLRMHQIQLANEQLRKDNAELYAKLQGSNTDAHVKSLLSDLQKIQDKLQAREDTLQKTEKQVREKEKKVSELNAVIDKQNQTMQSLRQRVADALKGYVGKGMAVEYKNGKVYVSMEESLLFTSGHWDVTPKADSALTKVAAFLAENKDIEVVIEGHTDDLAYRGNGYILDNWDLSTKRATAIVRSLLKNKKINPSRVSASGRAEFVPLDDSKTDVARRKNRRTEIILSPNMDELMNVINGK